MAEELIIPKTNSKKEKYESLLPQLESLVRDEPDLVANLANIVAALKEAMGFFWVGFYRVVGDELVLGPFQGPIACTRIQKGKGVCGAAWLNKESIIVPDVDQFPDHIACSSLSKSEIVILGIFESKVELILDVDSDKLNDFDEVDKQFLISVMELAVSKL